MQDQHERLLMVPSLTRWFNAQFCSARTQRKTKKDRKLIRRRLGDRETNQLDDQSSPICKLSNHLMTMPFS